MVRSSILLIALIVVVQFGRAQSEEEASAQSPDTRTVSIYVGAGFLELFAVGVQYQINEKFAVGTKADLGWASGGDLPAVGYGSGFKGSYFFSPTGKETFLSINVLNVEASYLRVASRGTLNSTLLEATIGHDSVERRGIGFFWLIGISRAGLVDGIDPPLLFPALKIGVHVDL